MSRSFMGTGSEVGGKVVFDTVARFGLLPVSEMSDRTVRPIGFTRISDEIIALTDRLPTEGSSLVALPKSCLSGSASRERAGHCT
jgi:hypothetical protein